VGGAVTCTALLTAITAPAAYPGVLAVGATDSRGQSPAYSLSGPQLAVVAPGGVPESGAPDNVQILSTNTGGGYGRGRGTSHAAAHVTGAVALVLQLEPGRTPPEVRNLVTQTALGGRIDVKNMIEALLP
jgi:subtilisin family serine protease